MVGTIQSHIPRGQGCISVPPILQYLAYVYSSSGQMLGKKRSDEESQHYKSTKVIADGDLKGIFIALRHVQSEQNEFIQTSLCALLWVMGNRAEKHGVDFLQQLNIWGDKTQPNKRQVCIILGIRLFQQTDRVACILRGESSTGSVFWEA